MCMPFLKLTLVEAELHVGTFHLGTSTLPGAMVTAAISGTLTGQLTVGCFSPAVGLMSCYILMPHLGSR
jgi:hypothetical protein